jgi:hypothetical protein
MVEREARAARILEARVEAAQRRQQRIAAMQAQRSKAT